MSATTVQYRITEIGSAGCMAAVVTAALFLMMYSLIATEVPELDESIKIRFDPVMVPPKPPEVETTQPPEPVAEPEPQPQFEAVSIELDIDPGSIVSTARRGPLLEDVKVGANLGDSGIVPIFRVQPEYPVSALRRGVEGYVDLLFDVTASGKTENIRVIAAEPSGVFERAAIRALKKWKYKPPMQDNVAYAQANMTTRISFAIDA